LVVFQTCNIYAEDVISLQYYETYVPNIITN